MNTFVRMREKRWGVFNHYICTPGRDEFFDGADLCDWNKTVDSFDTEKLAYELHKLGVGYYFITLIHGAEYMIAPNSAFDRMFGVNAGEFCSKRDLVNDLYESLAKYDIDLCLYFNCLSPFNMCFGERFRHHLGIDGELKNQNDILTIYDGETFVNSWSEVLRELAVRYGDKVKMWWLDSCYERSGYTPEKLRMYHDAIKEGNPDALIAFNNGILAPPNDKLEKYMDFEGFTCGEKLDIGYVPESGDIDGSLSHLLIPIGRSGEKSPFGPWCAAGTDYSGENLSEYIGMVNAVGGIVTFDIRVTPDGSFDKDQVEQLKKIR